MGWLSAALGSYDLPNARSPGSFLKQLLSSEHHGAWVKVAGQPVHGPHILVEKVLLWRDLQNLFHLVTEFSAFHVENNVLRKRLLKKPGASPKTHLTWSQVCSYYVLMKNQPLPQAISSWQRKCLNPARHETGIWMDCLLSVQNQGIDSQRFNIWSSYCGIPCPSPL